jgi:hypothetical protein
MNFLHVADPHKPKVNFSQLRRTLFVLVPNPAKTSVCVD